MVVVVYSTKLKIEKDHKSKIINQDQDLEKDQIKTEFQEQDQGPNKQGPRQPQNHWIKGYK